MFLKYDFRKRIDQLCRPVVGSDLPSPRQALVAILALNSQPQSLRFVTSISPHEEGAPVEIAAGGVQKHRPARDVRSGIGAGIAQCKQMRRDLGTQWPRARQFLAFKRIPALVCYPWLLETGARTGRCTQHIFSKGGHANGYSRNADEPSKGRV